MILHLKSLLVVLWFGLSSGVDYLLFWTVFCGLDRLMVRMVFWSRIPRGLRAGWVRGLRAEREGGSGPSAPTAAGPGCAFRSGSKKFFISVPMQRARRFRLRPNCIYVDVSLVRWLVRARLPAVAWELGGPGRVLAGRRQHTEKFECVPHCLDLCLKSCGSTHTHT